MRVQVPPARLTKGETMTITDAIAAICTDIDAGDYDALPFLADALEDAGKPALAAGVREIHATDRRPTEEDGWTGTGTQRGEWIWYVTTSGFASNPYSDFYNFTQPDCRHWIPVHCCRSHSVRHYGFATRSQAILWLADQVTGLKGACDTLRSRFDAWEARRGAVAS
jgi:hypothetical protein